ncbi:MAG: type VII secretion-associated protein [Mycobacteriaceae bacterium]|nr:type VII secretion-associated protein [Mycobacteriaceae bacterium]
MSGHCAVIEVGPGSIRRLCCGTKTVDDISLSREALAAVDDRVALRADSPVAVETLWRDVLHSLDCRGLNSSLVVQKVIVVHPSWWSASRVTMVAGAAQIVADHVLARPRSWLLMRVSPGVADSVTPHEPELLLVVEIADQFVVVIGAERVAQSRRLAPRQVAQGAVRIVAAMTCGRAATVRIDSPSTVRGASALATMIADGLRHADATLNVVTVDDEQLAQWGCAVLATESAAMLPVTSESTSLSANEQIGRARPWFGLPWGWVIGVIAVVAATLIGVNEFGQASVPPRTTSSTASLVEGQIALTIPAHWSTQRVANGVGSARIQVTSPLDPQVVVHITQAPAVGDTLDSTANQLKRTIDQQPPGVFVDFNPSAMAAGRSAVTYREVRPEHDIAWIILVDKAIRIGIGCQSRPAGGDAIRAVCDQAVRSVRVVR